MNEDRLLQVLLSPHVSEKSSVLAEKFRQYVFKVAKTATKHDISAAVEKLFDVKVQAVKILNVKPKVKRTGKTFGKRKGWKKAYIILQEGHDIDLSAGQA